MLSVIASISLRNWQDMQPSIGPAQACKFQQYIYYYILTENLINGVEKKKNMNAFQLFLSSFI